MSRVRKGLLVDRGQVSYHFVNNRSESVLPSHYSTDFERVEVETGDACCHWRVRVELLQNVTDALCLKVAALRGTFSVQRIRCLCHRFLFPELRAGRVVRRWIATDFLEQGWLHLLQVEQRVFLEPLLRLSTASHDLAIVSTVLWRRALAKLWNIEIW